MSIFNFAVKGFLKRRYEGIEHFMLYPHDVQEQVFRYLIKKGAKTDWGKHYDYKSINFS